MNNAQFSDIGACVFDAYGTLFDFNSAVEGCRDKLGDKADTLSATWRQKQLQYTWLRSLMGRYEDFWTVTGDALDFALTAENINDPPEAFFNDPHWVKVVKLAEVSRKQQVGEGHFRSLSEVPTHAITLTIPALLAPRTILCIVPETRKAEAVRSCLNEPVSEEHPGSILRTLKHASLYLDLESSANL